MSAARLHIAFTAILLLVVVLPRVAPELTLSLYGHIFGRGTIAIGKVCSPDGSKCFHERREQGMSINSVEVLALYETRGAALYPSLIEPALICDAGSSAEYSWRDTTLILDMNNQGDCHFLGPYAGRMGIEVKR